MPEILKWYFIKKKSLLLAQVFPSSLQPNRHGFSLGLSKLRSQEGSRGSQTQGGREIWAQTLVSPGGELTAHTEAWCHCARTASDQGQGLGTAGAPRSLQAHPSTEFASTRQTRQAYGSGHFASSDQLVQTENAQEK